MRQLRVWAVRFGELFHRKRRDQELADEIDAHVQMHTEDNLRAGMTPFEARRQALIKLGGMESTIEAYRERRGFSFGGTVIQDLRYALRQLAKTPAITTIVVITLALGIGVNSGIFSVLNGWLLRPLPVPAPEQIVVLAARQQDGSKFSFPDFSDVRKQADAFSGVFAYTTGIAGLSSNGVPAEFAYSAVSGNYFSTLGVKPLLGRVFLPGEGEHPAEAPQVVLGYSFWRRNFAEDRAIVGKQVQINGKSATVIGVTPKEFHGTFFAFDMDGYLPLSILEPSQNPDDFWTNRDNRGLFVLGRLRSDISLGQAQSSVDVIAKRLRAAYPASDNEFTMRVIPERLSRPAPLVSSFVPVIAALFLGLAGLVLLLACMNVANILLARAMARQREFGIRAALGAGRGRLIRQVLAESLILALLGGIAGAILGQVATAVSGSLLHSVASTSSNLGFHMDCSFDWRVFAYTLGAALFTGMLAGLWPAFRASHAEVNVVLHEGERGASRGFDRHRIPGLLVVAQVAGSLMLLVVAGLFVRSLSHAERMYLGFDPDHVLTVMLDPHQIGYTDGHSESFYRDLVQHVRALPGVQSASIAFCVPMGFPGHGAQIFIEGRPLAPREEPPNISFNSIDPGYLSTMRVPLMLGRNFSQSDDKQAPPVAIVNQAMASKFWPHENTIGKRFSLKSASGPFIDVVGVAHNGQYLFLSPDSSPYFYVPFAQNPSSFASLQLRSSGPPESLIPEVQKEIGRLAPDLPVMSVATMEQTVHGLAGMFIFRLAASLAGVIGILGLVLALVGLYGVVSFSVSRRTQEIGIRIAVGAQKRDILKLVSWQGLRLVIAGIAAGLALALALSHAMRKLLMGVSAADPATYLAVALMLVAVTLLACWLPARRAAKVDPMVALRYE